MDKLKVASAMHRHLSRRLAFLLDCKPEDFKQQRLGSLLHLIFTFIGDDCDEIGSFRTAAKGIIDLIGHRLFWADPLEPADEQPKAEKPVVLQ